MQDEEPQISEFLLYSGMASVSQMGCQSYGACRDLLHVTAGSLEHTADCLAEYPPELVAAIFRSWLRQQAERAARASKEITDNVVYKREQPDFTRCLSLTGTLFDFDTQMSILLYTVDMNHDVKSETEESEAEAD